MSPESQSMWHNVCVVSEFHARWKKPVIRLLNVNTRCTKTVTHLLIPGSCCTSPVARLLNPSASCITSARLLNSYAHYVRRLWYVFWTSTHAIRSLRNILWIPAVVRRRLRYVFWIPTHVGRNLWFSANPGPRCVIPFHFLTHCLLIIVLIIVYQTWMIGSKGYKFSLAIVQLS